MAEFYKWDPELLSVHVQEMDNEHIELISKMNALYTVCQNNESRDNIEKSLNDFASFTVKHFSDEESYMEKIKFSGLETHKIIHKQLLAQVGEHVEKFKNSGTLGDDFFKFLAVWLTSHIRGIDRKYGDQKQV